ncbi:hypothetical protein QYE76_050569 [Lolium multiflorum]|uniref:Glutathione S-transferase n=1 Tax=Lolium multiflorum TaxID=4521 RepID=A0AAD8WJQ5_LOLMU|nr:hypothetical protein QYE76_050569 [Lolium multiflorum]
MADVVLLDLWVSPFGQRCRIALAAKGVAYEYREQDLSNKSELLLRSNPVHRMIPVLLHGGRPVCESLLIVQYIDEAWPVAPRLLPGDPYARAQARFWADFVDKKIFDCGTRLWKCNGAALEQATRDMIEALGALEAELGGKDYFGGEDLGFLDVALAPFTAWFRTYEQCGGFAVAEHCPGLAAWADRCRGRDDVASALTDPDKVYEFALTLKEKFGDK